ncbi:dTDP-4-dehydrorhamnose reductase [Lysobacter sp. BMK333-48F3]|uniref:dTDP-4-dehydrorhamnose reductase n=1 Tax=Lysobacter sp. BMK333-48F3 TaxID=2867962 RepID=UPI001C8BFF94|nr:dTDP-4-dehydrorhamnose reductase [Lysobacter sp. BMK333-48F3]
MRLLLLGGDGQVGHELRRSLAPLGEVVTTTRSGRLAEDGSACETLDLAQPDAIEPLLRRVRPDHVINATAYTAVDRAENERELAFVVNAGAPERLAQLCAADGIGLIHYSTDYVFDGSGTRPYLETDPTGPISAYGESKLAGEEAIRASGADHLILRTAWVYATRGHNFLRTMLRLGGEREELRVVADQHGSPTPAWLLADAAAQVLRQGLKQSGVRHLVAGGQTSWHGFAEAIFEEALARGLIARQPRVEPIATADYPTPARRPAYSVLDSGRLRDEYGLDVPHWRAALAATLDRPAA